MRIAAALFLAILAAQQEKLPVGRSYVTVVLATPVVAVACPKATDFASVHSLCPLHKVSMVPTDIPAPWGHNFIVELDPVWRRQFEAARATLFPFTYPELGQGSCVVAPLCLTTVEFVCPECQRQEARWRKEYRSHVSG